MGEEEAFVDPDDGGIVDEVEEEEVVEDSLADIHCGGFDGRSGRGLAQDGMDTDPGKELEYVVQTLGSHESATAQCQQDHCGSCYDCAVDVEGGDY